MAGGKVLNWTSPGLVDKRCKRLESLSIVKSDKYRKRYTREFKEEAVRLLLTTDKSVKELARELGTSHVSLLNWKEEALHQGGDLQKAKGQDNPGVRVNYAVLEQENIRLKKEVEVLRQQRDILKKSLGILSHDPLREGMP